MDSLLGRSISFLERLHASPATRANSTESEDRCFGAGTDGGWLNSQVLRANGDFRLGCNTSTKGCRASILFNNRSLIIVNIVNMDNLFDMVKAEAARAKLILSSRAIHTRFPDPWQTTLVCEGI